MLGGGDEGEVGKVTTVSNLNQRYIELGCRIIESIPFGTQPVRTAVQTGNCLNKCSDSVTSEQLIKLDVFYTAVQRCDCLNSCLYSHSYEKP